MTASDLGRPDRVRSPFDDPGCTAVCFTQTSAADGRPAGAELVVDGIPSADEVAVLPRSSGSVRVLLRPALSAVSSRQVTTTVAE